METKKKITTKKAPATAKRKELMKKAKEVAEGKGGAGGGLIIIKHKRATVKVRGTSGSTHKGQAGEGWQPMPEVKLEDLDRGYEHKPTIEVPEHIVRDAFTNKINAILDKERVLDKKARLSFTGGMLYGVLVGIAATELLKAYVG